MSNKKFPVLDCRTFIFGEKNVISVIRKFDAFLSKYPRYRLHILYSRRWRVERRGMTINKEMGRERQIVLLKLPHKRIVFRYYRDSKASFVRFCES